jgi:hypothetical protein
MPFGGSKALGYGRKAAIDEFTALDHDPDQARIRICFEGQIRRATSVAGPGNRAKHR